MLKRIILILVLIGIIVLTVYGALSGTYTTNSYFYLPGYSSYGLEEYNAYNAAMQVADTQIKANKTMGEASVDTSGTPVANDIPRFTDANTIEGLSYAELKAVLDLEIGTDIQAYSADNAFRTDKLSAFAATTSAELAGVISDETGTNKLVYSESPTLSLPIIKGTTASDLPTYSAEFLDAANWTSTGWTGDWASGWVHTTGNTTTLSHDHIAVTTTKYQIAYTVTGRTAGTFTIAFGGQALAEISATGAFGPTATTTAVLTITPTTDFDGTIIISIKSITAISTPVLVYQSSEGTARIEIRANTGTNTTFIGNNAGSHNTTGISNTAISFNALTANTTGNSNVAIGVNALTANTTGNNNVAIGVSSLISNISGYQNIATGFGSLSSNTTGYNNVGLGYNVLSSNTTGYGNTAIGKDAFYTNIAGHSNTATGINSLRTNTGDNNSAFGTDSLYANTTGYQNTAMGIESLRYNTTGIQNSAVGATALRSNTTGSFNTAVGIDALRSNLTADNNTAVGRNALYANTTGYSNNAIGYNTLAANTEGYANNAMGAGSLILNTTGDYNNAMGVDALSSNTLGNANNAMGRYSLFANTTGSENVAMGAVAFASNTTGSYNVAIGSAAARYHVDGSTPLATPENSVYIGALTRGKDENDSNSIVIGYNAIGLGANTIVIGNSNITDAYVSGNLHLPSSAYINTVVTLGDTDLTPDVSAGNVFISQANTGATAITDLDNPTVGQIVTIICGNATNAPTIADGGNFKMNAAWNSTLDDSIQFFVKADNYYVELSRSTN